MKSFPKFMVFSIFLSAGILAFAFTTKKTSAPEEVITRSQVVLASPDVLVDGTEQIQAPVSKSLIVQKKTIKNITLERTNTVPVIGPIGAEAGSIAQGITQLAELGAPIYVVINSPGGSVMDGALIVSAIQAAPVPVYTVCLQLCASMASIIFESGTKRYMVDRAILMFHPAAGGVEGTFPQMQSRLTFFNNFVNKMDAEIAKRVGLTLPELTTRLNNELWLDAEDSLKQHFSDSIVNVTLNFTGGDQGPSNKVLASQTKAFKETFAIRLGN